MLWFCAPFPPLSTQEYGTFDDIGTSPGNENQMF